MPRKGEEKQKSEPSLMTDHPSKKSENPQRESGRQSSSSSSKRKSTKDHRYEILMTEVIALRAKLATLKERRDPPKEKEEAPPMESANIISPSETNPYASPPKKAKKMVSKS